MRGNKLVIVDYGMGNLGSISNMFKHLGFHSLITNDINEIESADKLILSGVGAFDHAINKLREFDLISILNEKVMKRKTPLMGICLGMQLLAIKSEEGKLPGLGWINASVVKFKFIDNDNKLKVPHMGWNLINQKKGSRLFKNMFNKSRFYFVHSYHLDCQNNNDILLTTNHGYDFISGIERDNIFGVQFHPEKSHKFGMKIFQNFAEL